MVRLPFCVSPLSSIRSSLATLQLEARTPKSHQYGGFNTTGMANQTTLGNSSTRMCRSPRRQGRRRKNAFGGYSQRASAKLRGRVLPTVGAMAVAEVAGNGGDVIFTVSWTSTVLLGLGVSSLPFFFPAERGASEKLKSTDAIQSDKNMFEELFSEEDGGSDGLKWTFISAVSCIPYLNWLAWVLAGIESAEQKRYFFFAFLYLLPYFRNSLDPFTLCSLVVCALHIQLDKKVALEGLATRAPTLADRDVPLLKSAKAPSSMLTSFTNQQTVDAKQRPSDEQQSGLPVTVDRALEVAAELLQSSRTVRTKFQDKLLKANLRDLEEQFEVGMKEEQFATREEFEEWDRKFQLRRLTVPELVVMAKQRRVRGYSKLRKEQLIELLERHTDGQ
mmetsp:Transcript_37940/g.63810  ORF Transcript_37940/g.63810 Transcript_37940/m.63810 type:complete len:390 (+) Transcript_37940:337-1506(+)|eukprot:CAMPEP_0198196780 /NCGR_PEP_ID=MMETSP1445-20131203/213_1 /TAXON_ID=36898 /ORGANISM="Pyramimonas sp., Strain CCMP2087" /LENGTH=389 /DNA_ID=CAMNT_0043865759 /DNA_START=337 /DNA_END=1506 /DNA_ORIENTATION=-